MAEAQPHARRDQPLVIRVTHWLNVPLLALMAMSGLQILVAYPYLGPRGAMYRWWPLQGFVPPDLLRAGGWLAGARALHFSTMWLLALNGLVYLVFVLASGEWRRRTFWPKRDTGNAVGTALHYLRIRPAPPQGFYNGLQRLAYTSAIGLGVLLVLSGLAIWKPVQFDVLAAILGGYDSARTLHLLALIAIAVFVVVHVVTVLLHPKTFPPMLTGGPERVPSRDDQQA
ncbi:MAG: cytochrome b/b6 domain-containing protein [Deltaproteobacteria bacterium]|nr:cytochrome b/b6 domain-containing protein [Deltaproteobacteria bacterium]